MIQHEPRHVEYTDCFVAFIDILGFTKLVEESAEDAVLLGTLTHALNAMAELPSGTKETRNLDAQGNMVEGRWSVQTRSFSDCIVVFMPKETGSLSQILFMVRFLHDRMLELGLPLRGAVTLGGMYWHEAWNHVTEHDSGENNNNVPYERGRTQNLPVTVGPGLIEACSLESKCAIYPRILISRKLYEHAREQKLRCSPLGPYTPPDRLLTDFVRRDADGLFFLDLFHPEITRNDTERIVRAGEAGGGFTVRWEYDSSTHNTVITNVKELAAKWLDDDDTPEKIRMKYEWLKSYANQINGENLKTMEANP